MRVIVCGGRHYCDRRHLFHELDALHLSRGVTEVIHGAARGADSLAGEWARIRGVKETAVPADWDRHGRGAGMRRNTQMAEMKPDAIVAFPGGRGTANMVAHGDWYQIEVLKR